MSETIYKHIINQFLNRVSGTEMFIDQYIAQWKYDRDNGYNNSYEPKLQRLLNRLFTSCDCYNKNPEAQFEISEEELRREVSLLYYIWWDNITD